MMIEVSWPLGALILAVGLGGAAYVFAMRRRIGRLEAQLETQHRALAKLRREGDDGRTTVDGDPSATPLVEELRRQRSQLALVNDINSLLVGDPFSGDVMESYCRTLKEEFSLILVSIYLLDKEQGLKLLAHCGEGIPEDHTHLALDGQGLASSDGLIARCVKQQQPVYAPDVSKVPGFLQGHPDVRSEYAIPLRAGGKVIGALNLESVDLDGFDDRLRRLLDRVARQGSLAIQRADFLSQLQEKEHRYKIATSAGQVSLWDWNLETGDFFMGDVILAALGLEPGDIDQHVEAWMARFPPDDLRLIEEAIRACILGKTDTYALEHRIRHANGGFRWVMARAEPIRRPDGKTYRLVGAVTDITEKKKYELALLEAKETAEAASAAKSDFLARMSHELRTPLHGVIGSASLLSTKDLDGDATFLVDTIQLSARVLLSTINDILEVSKIEAGHVQLEEEAFSVADCIENTLRVVEGGARKKGLTLEYHIEDAVPETLLGDFIRLRQVLINLSHNAIKFTEQGSVVLRVARLDAEEDPVLLQFSVQDTGKGIPKDQQQRLFDPFTQGDTSATRRHDGTGLGLAICHHLVQLMGGNIWIESEEDQGSTFLFTLRARIPSQDALPFSDRSAVDGTQGHDSILETPLHVLVAEDNPVNQKVTEMQLRALGCTAHIAKDGLATLEAYSQQPFDLILMDCQMPELNGFDTTQQIRSQETDTHLPIIGLTAYATEADRRRCLDSGMDDYLAKPITVQDLATILTRWSRRQTASQVELPPGDDATPITAAMVQQELLDGPTLERLKDLSTACGEDVLSKAVGLFARDAPRHLQAMQQHLAALRPTELANSAHSLKGSAGVLGALRLSTLCREIERMGREARIEDADRWVVAAEDVLGQTLESLRKMPAVHELPQP